MREIDLPPDGRVDHEFRADAGTSRALCLRFDPEGAEPWTGQFFASASPMSGLTGWWQTPDAGVIVVACCGAAYAVDLRLPGRHVVLSTSMVQVLPPVGRGPLLLVTPWDIRAVVGLDVGWVAAGLSTDGITISGVSAGEVHGVASGAGEDARFVVGIADGAISWC